MPRVGLIDTVMIDADGVVGGPIKVDATVTEDHSLEAEVSSYPIEDGSDIVDNVRIKPMSITLDCIFTDTPMDELVINGQLPSTAAYLAINKLFQSKKLVAIESSLDRFEDMVLVSVSFPRSAANGYALSAKLDFQQVVIIENIRTTVNVPNRGGGAKAEGPIAVVFSVPTSRRAEFSSRFELMVTDKTPPTKTSGGGSWDHWNTVPSGYFGVTNNPFVDRTSFAASDTLADGYVTLKDKTYHPYSNPFKNSIEGFKFDRKSGKWLGSDGKPVPENAAEAVKESKNPKADWYTITAEDLD